MDLLHKLSALAVAGVITSNACALARVQNTPSASEPAQQQAAPAQTQATPNASSGIAIQPEAEPSSQTTSSAAATPATSLTSHPSAAKTYTVPAGTKVLLQLRSGINTRNAKPGDGVYLASTFPVVVGNRVMIPAGVYVQGTIDHVVRAGHIKGRSQLDMHFTSIIFPNGSVVEIPGIVNSLPGARQQSVKDDGEGTIEQSPDKGRNAGEVAKIAIPTGGTIGSIGGLATGHPIAGGVAGLGAGLAAAGLVSLFTRGADVNIDSGTQVEMLLQRPLILEETNLSGTTPALQPSPDQPRPLGKPDPTNLRCPPGSLGCD